jgi:hypothetical protein
MNLFDNIVDRHKAVPKYRPAREQSMGREDGSTEMRLVSHEKVANGASLSGRRGFRAALLLAGTFTAAGLVSSCGTSGQAVPTPHAGNHTHSLGHPVAINPTDGNKGAGTTSAIGPSQSTSTTEVSTIPSESTSSTEGSTPRSPTVPSDEMFGTITWPDGSPVVGVQVEFTDLDGLVSQNYVTTGSNGSYDFQRVDFEDVLAQIVPQSFMTCAGVPDLGNAQSGNLCALQLVPTPADASTGNRYLAPPASGTQVNWQATPVVINSATAYQDLPAAESAAAQDGSDGWQAVRALVQPGQ